MEIRRTNKRLKVSTQKCEGATNPGHALVATVESRSPSKHAIENLAARQARRELFDLQGDCESQWLDLESEPGKGEMLAHEMRGLVGRQPKSKSMQFLRIDSPIASSRANAKEPDLPVRGRMAISTPAQSQRDIRPATPFVAVPLPRFLFEANAEESSLDTVEASELNRIAAIRVLALVEHQQELWLKKVKDYP